MLYALCSGIIGLKMEYHLLTIDEDGELEARPYQNAYEMLQTIIRERPSSYKVVFGSVFEDIFEVFGKDSGLLKELAKLLEPPDRGEFEVDE